MPIYRKLKRLLLLSEQKQVLLLLCLMFVAMIFETMGLGLVIPAMTMMTQIDVIQHNPTLQPFLQFLNFPTQTQLIIGAMLGLVVIYSIKTGFLFFMTRKQNRFVYNLRASLSHRLFMGYMHQPWTFHLQRNSAQLILNVTNEVTLFVESVLQAGMVVLTEGFVLVGIAVLLTVIEPVGALISVGVLGGAVVLSQYMMRHRILRWGQARQYHEGLRLQYLQQGLGGSKDAKLLGRELYFINQYDEHNRKSADVGQKQRILQDLPRLWLELIAITGLAVLVLVMLAQGKSAEALVPTLGLFAAAAFRLMPSLNRVLGAVQNIRYGLPIVNRLYDEICLFDDDVVLIKAQDIFSFKQNLVLENVIHSYADASQLILNNISFIVQRGSSVGLIGPSGAGKSTLIDTILGLLTPTSGKIKVDGVDIQSNLRGWQDQIGYVPQHIFLTDDTIRRNIAFGLPDDLIDDLAIERAIQAAQLKEFIESLPQQLDTIVGERGVRLSGGQRQRIGIARALYHDPEVLVLDEATSSLDVTTEQEVMNAVNALHGQKTLIIVAHRLSTVAKCDYKYEIQKGSIVLRECMKDVLHERIAIES